MTLVKNLPRVFFISRSFVLAPIVNMEGKRYGLLTVGKIAGRGAGNSILWECTCECGRKLNTMGRALRQGTTRSCGCRRGTSEFKEQRLLELSRNEKAFRSCLKRYLKIRNADPLKLSSAQYRRGRTSIRLLDFVIDFEKITLPILKQNRDAIGAALIAHGIYPLEQYFA
jgi:hypothetical protein